MLGRRAGSAAGFGGYSDALAASRFEWSAATLDAYTSPGRNLFATLSVLHNLELGGITLPHHLRAERIAEVFDVTVASLPGSRVMVPIGRIVR